MNCRNFHGRKVTASVDHYCLPFYCSYYFFLQSFPTFCHESQCIQIFKASTKYLSWSSTEATIIIWTWITFVKITEISSSISINASISVLVCIYLYTSASTSVPICLCLHTFPRWWLVSISILVLRVGPIVSISVRSFAK